MLTDNAPISFLVNHYIRRKIQERNWMDGLNIDFSKEYDRLEWSSIENMLSKFGFHQRWVSRFMSCVRIVSYKFLHNGEVFCEIKPQSGVRQEDPISPYLYILCAEGLSSIIRRHEEAGLIHGCVANASVFLHPEKGKGVPFQ